MELLFCVRQGSNLIFSRVCVMSLLESTLPGTVLGAPVCVSPPCSLRLHLPAAVGTLSTPAAPQVLM